MPTLAGINGASLSGDQFGAFKRGRQFSEQLKNQQLNRETLQAEQAKQKQIAQLRGQAIPGTPGFNPNAERELLALDPEGANQLFDSIGARSQGQRDDAARDAFAIANAPPGLRNQVIQQRAAKIKARGGDATDTLELLDMPPEQQDQVLDVIQRSALTAQQRTQGGRPSLQNVTEAEGGGFVGIDPTTRESVFVPPPSGKRTQKQVDAEIKSQEARVKADVAASEDVFDRAKKLRSEITNASTEFNKIDSAFGRIEASSEDPSAAGDLALIFNFMKMLDPGSVVRESEFATAANAAGVPDRIRNVYNRAINGERLGVKQREDFLNQAKKIFRRSSADNVKAVDKIIDIGDQFGVKRSQLVGREDQAEAGAVQDGQTATNPQTGEKIIFSGGQWVPA